VEVERQLVQHRAEATGGMHGVKGEVPPGSLVPWIEPRTRRTRRTTQPRRSLLDCC
jgi:hypothetical protein